MEDGALFAAIIATFLLAGTVKGVIGLGLPTVSLGLLTVAADLPTAMALLLIPSFVTNLWQAVVGGKLRELLSRTWPFLLLATLTVWLGAWALTQVDLAYLSALLGLLLVAYAVISLAGLRLTVTPGQEVWAGPLTGAVNGVLTGMTGSFVVPGVMYLQAIGLPRDMLIQAMGVLFTLSTLALAYALQSNQLLTAEKGLLSLAGLVPALVGMVVGQKIRAHLPESTFRRIFFSALLLLGVYICGTATMGP
ncbi:MAG: sulfite exporter TauE/SafE family protein [Pseudomonadota bacterium]